MKEKLQQAFQLRQNQNYQQAIDIYQPLWQQDQHQFDDWAGWSYAFSLSKLNRHAEALEICRALFPRYKNSEILNSLYAKCIYYTQFTGRAIPELDVMRKAAQAMFQLSPPYNEYSFTPRAIFKLIKLLLGQQQIDWKEIEKWLLKLDPDLLDNRPFRMTDGRGKQVELASPKEEWYSYMIRTRGGLNQPKALLEALEAARKQNIKWHYNNDIWFARKEAFAFRELGEREKAEKILRRIVQRKKDWFLLYDLSQVIKDEDEALRLRCNAALAAGPSTLKLKLYHSLYLQLKNKEQYREEALLHLCLEVAVREENNWKITDEQQKEIDSSGVNRAVLGSSSAIIKKLTSFWKTKTGTAENEQSKVRATGIVDFIFPNQKTGFVLASGNKYLFRTDALEGKISKGTKISFELIDSFDKKKNLPSKLAIRIQAISK